MKPPSLAPVYCAMYPDLARIAREHGYALAVHGSLSRDFDLICIPWIESPSEPGTVVSAFCEFYAIRTIGDFEEKMHGRIAQTVSISWGECQIDLSFMPRVSTP
jgi:hypothetical protein